MAVPVPDPAAWRIGVPGGSMQLPRGGGAGMSPMQQGGSVRLPRGGATGLSPLQSTAESLRAELEASPAFERSLKMLNSPMMGTRGPQGVGVGQAPLTGEGKFAVTGIGAWRPRPPEAKVGAASMLGTQAATVALNRTDASLAVLAAMVEAGPERPRLRQRPPFQWLASPDYESEFEVSGRNKEIVTKVGDFRDPSWVIPVGSTLQLMKGASYRWTLRIEKLSPHQPQMQLGIHGSGHRRPWRLLTTSRCSRARDDEPWRERPEGDHEIQEGDFVHFEVDLRGLHLPFGTMSIALNTGPPEVVFDDIPLSVSTPVMPVVSMGGDQSRVRLCPAY
mmetsp:Transcript_54954/g.100428  ORF Transcript_54954/g.100428 Transcript_54954/m.100428 type:complete len:334 (-) Transcript_54954:83-1084(-)